MIRLVNIAASLFTGLLKPLPVSVIARPIPGIDAHFHQYCKTCDTSTSHASRGGYCIGGTLHCYKCGTETLIAQIPINTSTEEMITSSWAHWQKFPRIPFNWHELSEDQRWSILGRTLLNSLTL